MVQQYEDSMRTSRNMAKEARKTLASFCKEGVEELIAKGYTPELDIGRVGNILSRNNRGLYWLEDGKLYRSSAGERDEISLDDTPFDKIRTDNLRSLARFIEQERSRYSTGSL